MVHPLRQWVRRLFASAKHSPPSAARNRPVFRPKLEMLEDRITPAVTFHAPIPFTVGANPESVAVGDFLGTGHLDQFVVANAGASTVTVTIGIFTQATFTVGANPTAVAVADINGDGKPDIVTTNPNGTISVLLNTTAAGATVPSFAPQVTFALNIGNDPVALAVGDFNGDGKPDLVIANKADGTVTVLVNTTAVGATTPSFNNLKPFFAPLPFTVGADPVSVAVADINGDGRPDIVVANAELPGDSAGTISVLLNTTTGVVPGFAAQQTFAAGPEPDAVAVGDFNGDGRPDIVVADFGGAEVSVLLNKTTAGATTASFATPKFFAAGNNPSSVTTADLDGDGRPDIAVVNEGDSTLSVLVDTTAARATAPSFAVQQTFTVGNSPYSVAAADFSSDGRPDVITANFNGTSSLLLNTTAPFATAVPVVVADVHGMGVVEYNRTTGAWVQLNVANPSDVTLLAADAAGDVFADYAGYGVFRYTPSVGSWQPVNGTDAVAMAVDSRGDVFLSYNGAGIAVFRLDGSSHLLTPSTASILAADPNGDLAGEFRGYGVMRYTPSTGVWTPLNGTDAVALTIDARGDVFASFNGAGIGEFRLDGSSQPLTPSTASMLAVDANGDLAGEFVGYGVMRYTPSNGAWTPLNGTDAAALAEDAAGDVFASFPGAGVGEFPLSGGGSTVNASAALLLAADPFGDPFAAL